MENNKFKIYERCWDLTNYSKEELTKYNLEKAVYIYIGRASEKTYISNRNSAWRTKYKNKELPNKIQEFIENLEKFYRDKNFSEDEIKEKVFNNAIPFAYCENEKQLRMMEIACITKLDLIYKMLDELVVEDPMILLNTRDSNVKQEKINGVTAIAVNPFK